MEYVSIIIDAAMIILAFVLADRTYKRNKQEGMNLLGTAFSIISAIGIAFIVAQIMGDTMLGIIDYTPSYSPFDIVGLLAASVLAAKAIFVFGPKAKEQ